MPGKGLPAPREPSVQAVWPREEHREGQVTVIVEDFPVGSEFCVSLPFFRLRTGKAKSLARGSTAKSRSWTGKFKAVRPQSPQF